MSDNLKTPENFDFPFPPYEIQTKFMSALYEALEFGKLGIFESPTGTGKSLSLICGSLKWLFDHEKFSHEQLKYRIEECCKSEKQDDVNWFEVQTSNRELQLKKDKFTLELKILEKYKEKIEKLKTRKKEKTDFKRPKWLENKINSEKEAKSTSELKNQESDIDDEDCLLDAFGSVPGLNSDSSDEENDEEEPPGVKIYICSRTHSQLAQLVGEVNKSPYGKNVRLTTLASRKNYCINESVLALKNMSLINDRCLDLQKKKKGKSTLQTKNGQTLKRQKTSSGCPFMIMSNIEELKNEALTEVQDIEQLVYKSRTLKACPYYSTRAAVRDSQVVVLPYNTLLHKSTREASGVKLKGNIVIIDEAHNLLDAIGNMHCSMITGQQLINAHSQLTQYEAKYSKLFSALSKLRLTQLIRIIKQLMNALNQKSKDTVPKSNTAIFTLQDFLFNTDIADYNLYEILKFCKLSKLSHKIHSFVVKYEPSVNVHAKNGISSFLKSIKPQEDTVVEESKLVPNSNSLLAIIGFIECLTNKCDDGRILCDKKNLLGNGIFKFLLLNPASHFTDIIENSRSVIVAGGTMQPFSEFRNQLFLAAGGETERIMEFSCGHVISPDNILPIALPSGPSGREFNFSFMERSNYTMMDELASSMLKMVSHVPGGVVCFFPSYEYEKEVFAYMERKNYIEQINEIKQVFREPKVSALVDKVLNDYAKAIKCPPGGRTGAMLFSVVGGKLSEGLNFNDDLGRCIILVGRPYPNIKSLELLEKKNYIQKHMKGEGDNYFESLCSKAVNQSIGRAVRHKNDYASIFLLDKRYLSPSVQKTLPSWIQNSLQSLTKFEASIALLTKFFEKHKELY